MDTTEAVDVARADSSLVRDLNRQAALDALRLGGPMTRAELATELNLARPTVAAITAELVESGRVDDIPDDRPRLGSGRPPRLLAFNPFRSVVVGVAVSPTGLVVSADDGLGRPLGTRDVVLSSVDPAAVIAEIVETLGSWAVLDEPRRVEAVGVCVPGSVDPATGHVRSDRLGWRNVPFGTALGKETAAKVSVHEVHQAMAAAELRQGALVGVSEAVVVDVTYGVRCAIVTGGTVYRGATGNAGAVGQMRLADTSGERAPADVQSLVESPSTFGRRPPEDRNRLARQMAVPLAWVADVLAPQVILLGGIAAALPVEAVDVFEKEIRRLVGAELAETIEFRRSSLGPSAAVRGVTLLAGDGTRLHRPAALGEVAGR